MRWIRGGFQLTLAVFLLSSCDDDATTGLSTVVETVAVIPGVFSLVVGDTVRLVTLARGEVGNPVVGPDVVWATSSPSVLTLSATGLATAVGPGAAIVTATIEGKVGTATATVSPNFGTVAFTAVIAGGAHSCALTSIGSAYCWGRSESGQLGVPPPGTTCLDTPLACGLVPFPVDGGLKFERLSAGGAHTCGLTSDGAAWCWGSNSSGQLGDGSLTARSAPVAVATDERFTRIVSGQAHTCAMTSSGTAWCWGHNQSGQLGDGTTQRRTTPVRVVAPGVTFQQIVVGGSSFRGFSCGLANTGITYCWGVNDRGQLGRGSQDFDPHPQPAPISGGYAFRSVTAGFGDHVCGLNAAGAPYCWGGGGSGELGDGGGNDSLLPLAVPGGVTFVQIVTGGPSGDQAFTCGLTSSGAAYCWGSNSAGSIGDGTVGGVRKPVVVIGGLQFESISAGFRHTCGRTMTGTLYCWGSGSVGQLGCNYRVVSAVPLKVAGQP